MIIIKFGNYSDIKFKLFVVVLDNAVSDPNNVIISYIRIYTYIYAYIYSFYKVKRVRLKSGTNCLVF